jgi:membrane protease YdiL (CAAX protease family)
LNKSIRNLIIFAVVTAGAGFVGLALDRAAGTPDPQAGPGILLWLVAPVAAALLLRAFGGDGWQDFGFWPRLKASWAWYVTGMLMVVVVFALSTGVGLLAGTATLAGPGLAAFLPLVGTAFAASLVKNVFEEVAWRGYLTPRLAALRLNPAFMYVLTGLVWASWHIPYYLFFMDRAMLAANTTLSAPALILVSFFILPFHALAYGELRFISGSVWPGVFMHTLANAIGFVLIGEGFVRSSGNFLLSPSGDGLLYTLLFGLAGLGLYLYRTRRLRVGAMRSAASAARPV